MINKALIVNAIVGVTSAALAFFAGKNIGERDHKTIVDRQADHPIPTGAPAPDATLLINPLLDCENASPSRIAVHAALESELRSKIRKAISDSTASHISVYFRALNNGPWVGINEHEGYSPASLMKVPLMVAVLKRAMGDPAFLKRQIRYDSAFAPGVQTSISDRQIEVGKTYSIEYLVEQMIRYSDNEAGFLLMREITPAFAGNVFREIGILAPDEPFAGDFTSVREYAAVFRLLYNATYLDRAMSTRALELLTNTNYRAGITGSLPPTVTVAHKFGERLFPNSQVTQLHDCGIVYMGKAPYVLCVMTRGNDTAKLGTLISDLSRGVYDIASRSESQVR